MVYKTLLVLWRLKAALSARLGQLILHVEAVFRGSRIAGSDFGKDTWAALLDILFGAWEH